MRLYLRKQEEKRECAKRAAKKKYSIAAKSIRLGPIHSYAAEQLQGLSREREKER